MKIKCSKCGFLLYDGKVADLQVDVEGNRVIVKCPRCGRVLNHEKIWDYLVDAFFGFL